MYRAFSILLLCVSISLALVPDYGPGVRIKNAWGEIDVGFCSDPALVDWDGDGKRDLILAIYNQGNILCHENKGTDASPYFRTYYQLKSDGVSIKLPAS